MPFRARILFPKSLVQRPMLGAKLRILLNFIGYRIHGRQAVELFENVG
jgi:hypothetical protein